MVRVSVKILFANCVEWTA